MNVLPMEREAEIDQIRRELAMLQSRYALYRRLAAFWRMFFIMLTPPLIIGAAIVAFRLFRFDILYGLFFVGGLLLVISVLVWVIRSSELRWIDFAVLLLAGIFHPDFFSADPGERRRVRSVAEMVEQQIADREQRLSVLQR
ncbi:MAG TPA: hypothetical protein VFB45_17685 [Pseudolabrys sp.]|nr:hypothetical protein [Pseudolabrys sp.]